MFDQIFGPTGQISWTQECARAAVIFVYGLAVVRLAGRRVFAQWTALDIIVAILTGSTLSRALTGNADLVGTLAATSLLFVLHGVVSHASARSVTASRWLEGGAVRLGAMGAWTRRPCGATRSAPPRSTKPCARRASRTRRTPV
jgi:uncharacterized membrane protein YcaP (DUF421 family)